MNTRYRTLIQAITGDNDDLVLLFFAAFSRFEYALKRAGFVKGDRNDNALADWDTFAAEKVDGRLATTANTAFIDARSHLVQEPPQKQIVNRSDKRLHWQPNYQWSNESEAQYLLRLVRDVRNNVFHGGKYAAGDGPGDGSTLRNTRLLESCLAILEECLSFDDRVDSFFGEAPS